MQFENEKATARMLAKIRGLLAKAESTEFPEEADALTAKAQALMSAYSIDEALLRQEAVRNGSVRPSTRTVIIEKPYVKHKAHLLSHIADANNSKVVWNAYLGTATLFGFDADLDLVEILYTSLLVQADAALGSGNHPGSEASSTRSYRSSFLYGFGSRIGQRLHEAKECAVEAAGSGAELVLASQIEVITHAVAQAYPNVRSSRGSISSFSGWAAGTEAANGADIGHRRHVNAG